MTSCGRRNKHELRATYANALRKTCRHTLLITTESPSRLKVMLAAHCTHFHGLRGSLCGACLVALAPTRAVLEFAVSMQDSAAIAEACA